MLSSVSKKFKNNDAKKRAESNRETMTDVFVELRHLEIPENMEVEFLRLFMRQRSFLF